MIITKKRIRTTTSFNFLSEDENFVIATELNNQTIKSAIEYGFDPDFLVGSSILPAPLKSVSRRNAEGYFIKHKDLPKEKYYIEREWTREQWIGGGDTEEVTSFVIIERERYQRTRIRPTNIRIQIIERNGIKYFSSKIMKLSDNNNDSIIITANLFLELFGYFGIFNENLEGISKSKIVHLDWDVLPAGEWPWKNVRKLIADRSSSKPTVQSVIVRRADLIYKNEPDFIAVGRAGFRGYVIYGFKNKNLFVLESSVENNATYVFENNWEELSQLTKSEILCDNLQKYRLIHNKNWESELSKLFR